MSIQTKILRHNYRETGEIFLKKGNLIDTGLHPSKTFFTINYSMCNIGNNTNEYLPLSTLSLCIHFVLS